MVDQPPRRLKSTPRDLSPHHTCIPPCPLLIAVFSQSLCLPRTQSAIVSTICRDNATQSTPQLGSLTTILSSSFISALRPPAKCASNILKTRHRIHIDPNHKIHFHAQTRPLRTSSRPRSPHQHIYRSARAKSPQHTPANGSSRPQEGHDIHLRPRNREAHSMHRFTT